MYEMALSLPVPEAARIQFGEIRCQPVGPGQVCGRMAGGQPHDPHAGRVRRGDPRRGVFKHHAFRRRHPQSRGRGEENVRRGLAARESGDAAAWAASGCAGVADRLLAFLAMEKQQVLEVSVRRQAAEVADEVLLALRLSARALAMPLEELEEKHRRFDAALLEAEQQRRFARDMLIGEQKRMAELVEAHAATLREQYRARLTDAAMAALSNDGSEAAAVEAMAALIAASQILL